MAIDVYMIFYCSSILWLSFPVIRIIHRYIRHIAQTASRLTHFVWKSDHRVFLHQSIWSWFVENWVWVNTYRYILVGWTSIYQLFWCSPGVQGFDTLPIGNWWLCPHHSCHSSDSKHCPDWNRWWHETCTQKRQDFLCNEAKLSQLPGLWGPVLWNSWRVSKPWTGPTSKQRPSLAVLWTTRSLRDRGCLHEMETVGR